jgi:hypothetical protein
VLHATIWQTFHESQFHKITANQTAQWSEDSALVQKHWAGRCILDGSCVEKIEQPADEERTWIVPFGGFLENRLGIEKDMICAVEYYQLSAGQEHSFGQNNSADPLSLELEILQIQSKALHL